MQEQQGGDDMTGLCQECKHWILPGSPNEMKPDPRLIEFGICNRTRSSYTGPEDDLSRAVALAEEDAPAWLMTHPSFGCVQFEPM